MTLDLDAIFAALGPAPLPWIVPEPRVVTTWTDEATGLRCAMRPTGAFPGGWCAYLEVPEGVALEDLGAPADWVGAYEGMPGWDTGHAHMEDWTEERVRAELTREAGVARRLTPPPEPWPRWDGSSLDSVLLNGEIEGSVYKNAGIFLSGEDHVCKGGIRAEKKPRGTIIEWWRRTPKSSKMHRVATVEEAVRAIVAAGASEPPPRMVNRLAAWASR